jgi:hypothetical protein
MKSETFLWLLKNLSWVVLLICIYLSCPSMFSNQTLWGNRVRNSSTSGILPKVKIIHFHGGGIFFWWQAGAAKYLLEQGVLNDSSIEFVGGSAGSIAVSCILANVDFHHAASVATNSVSELNLWESPTGLFGIWGNLVNDFLNELILPANLTEKDLSRVHIAVTPRFIFSGTRHISNFQSKEDLIDAVMTSIHIPFFMDGNAWRTFRGNHFIDGSFWQFLFKIKPHLPEAITNRFLAPQEKISLVVEEDVKNETEVFASDENSVLSFEIDYRNDKILQEFSRNIHVVKLIKPEICLQMLELGYQYMEREFSTQFMGLITKEL